MTLTAEEALDAMAEIEQNTPQQIKTKRSHARIAVRAKVTAQPANSSQRNSFQTHGVLGDISRGGCRTEWPARLYDIDGTDSRVAVLSVPIRDDRGHTGAVAVVVPCADRTAAEADLFELRSLTLLACALASSVHTTSECDPASPARRCELLAKPLDFRR